MANNLKTAGLLGLMSALVWYLGIYLFGEGQGLYIGLGFALMLNMGAYFFSDKIALASSRAIPADETELPEVHRIVDELTHALGMPKPGIYRIPSAQPNAFATGRSPNKAAVAVTDGIMATLTERELRGVLAHELAHVQNRDILIASVAAMLGAALSIFSRMAMFGGGRRSNDPVSAVLGILTIIVAPLAAMLLRFAISRSREFQADESGAAYTGDPMALADALEKISAGAQAVPMRVNEATASLYIENPLKGARFSRMLSTHPPAEERIARLRQMSSPISAPR